MATGQDPAGLELTEEEAVALLGMCLTSPEPMDAVSEIALRKLAEYCIRSSNHKAVYQPDPPGRKQATA